MKLNTNTNLSFLVTKFHTKKIFNVSIIVLTFMLVFLGLNSISQSITITAAPICPAGYSYNSGSNNCFQTRGKIVTSEQYVCPMGGNLVSGVCHAAMQSPIKSEQQCISGGVYLEGMRSEPVCNLNGDDSTVLLIDKDRSKRCIVNGQENRQQFVGYCARVGSSKIWVASSGVNDYFAYYVFAGISYNATLNQQFGCEQGFQDNGNDCIIYTGVSNSPVGYLDNITSDGTVQGWVYDQDNSSASVWVHFYVDGTTNLNPVAENIGTMVGSTLANIPRSDLNQNLNIQGNHAFNFKLPIQYCDGNTHTIATYGIDLEGLYNYPGLQYYKENLKTFKLNRSDCEPQVQKSQNNQTKQAVEKITLSKIKSISCGNLKNNKVTCLSEFEKNQFGDITISTNPQTSKCVISVQDANSTSGSCNIDFKSTDQQQKIKLSVSTSDGAVKEFGELTIPSKSEITSQNNTSKILITSVNEKGETVTKEISKEEADKICKDKPEQDCQNNLSKLDFSLNFTGSDEDSLNIQKIQDLKFICGPVEDNKVARNKDFICRAGLPSNSELNLQISLSLGQNNNFSENCMIQNQSLICERISAGDSVGNLPLMIKVGDSIVVNSTSILEVVENIDIPTKPEQINLDKNIGSVFVNQVLTRTGFEPIISIITTTIIVLSSISVYTKNKRNTLDIK
jgi:hypothetical protein